MSKAAEAMGDMLALEELACGDTSIHRLHPLSKLVVTLLYVGTVISVGRLDFVTLSLFFFYPAVLIALAGIPLRAVIHRVMLALPFVLLMGLSNVLLEPVAYFTLWGLDISRGLVSLIVLMEKALLAVSAVLILMATTPLARLLSGLRSLGVPKVLLMVLLLSVRYLSLLAGEADRMGRAYHLRSVKAKGIRMRDMGSFAGQLLLRSFDRAERVYQAMKLRGFDGNFRAGDAPPMKAADVGYAALACALILGCRFFTLGKLMALLIG